MVNLYLLLSLGIMAVAGVCYALAAYVQKKQATQESHTTELETRVRHEGPQAYVIEKAQQMGFSQSWLKNGLLLLLIISVSFIVGRMFGSLAFVISFVTCLLIVTFLARLRKAKMRLRLTQQLPSFIDQVHRRIKVGLTVPQAVDQSAKVTTSPLKDVLQRVNDRRAIGIELQHAFIKESQITGVPALRLLGSIFSINTRYGGSITDSLDSLVKLLRQQDLSRRELKSITGETRITAWVIGSAPVLVSAYMLTQNPELLINMWYSETGRQALLFGIVLQLSGIVVIWRMFRSL
ncbi:MULTISPECIES: type II secretion system F family protein [Vibrio]|uniref:Type II secretion system F family protein n=1 Tax=Vibrio ostreae TaxID=2841925 RepID=A0A975UAP5_9VIBR|nr:MULTISPECIES: type II secretion system F family protein [Vibrio]QXO18339.1 type II secretion system F family protein [Vibrio ostreae]